jgi:hypothetical protein
MNPIIKYFTGEKAESYLFLLLGLVGIAIAIYMLMTNSSSFWRGFIIPLILVSILEVIVGFTIINRSPKDIIRVENYVQNNIAKIKTLEIPRMEKVMKNFQIFRYSEIALMIIGILIFLAFSNLPFWKGFGAGLFIQSGIVLILDFFAEKRGYIYLEYLNTLTNA